MMKNTIFKKVKSIHSKSNSKYYKNNIESNNPKLQQNSSNKDNLVKTDINYNFNSNSNAENHTNFLTITIEKESLNNNNINSDYKIKPINNKLNLSNKYQIKNKYIFIEKQKNLSPNIKQINNCINYTQKKITSKRINANLISIKKNKNFCKNLKDKVNMNNNSQNSNKELNKIIIEQEKQTLKNSEINNDSLNIENRESINENKMIKNKCKHYNLKLKKREKSLSKKNKLLLEEEKTIVNDINYINNLNIMDYFHKLNNTAENNNKNNNHKIIIQDINNNDEINMNNNNINNKNNDNRNMKSNLSNNLINSEKKKVKDNIEEFHNNKMVKQREINKKMAQKKLVGNNKANITDNKEKKNYQNQHMLKSKLSNKKLIKKNLIKKKRNNLHEKEEINQNISSGSINRNLFMKNEENPSTYLYKNHKKIKENINNSYFEIMEKQEFREMKEENFYDLNKANNILLINNNSEEKINIIPNSKYINSNNQTQKKLKPLTNNEIAYISQDYQNKMANNSTNNIHNHKLNKDMIKIKIKNNKQEEYIKKHSYKNNNIRINLNFPKKKTMKRSTSPDMNNNMHLRHTANINNYHVKKIESNFFLNEIFIDLSKKPNNNLNNTGNNEMSSTYKSSPYNFTTKNKYHKHTSPKNTIKSKKLFTLYSNFTDKDNKNVNILLNNLNSTYTNSKRFTINKNNHININVEKIFTTDNKANIKMNKEKVKIDIDIIGVHTLPKKKMNFISEKNDIKNLKEIKNINLDESLGDIQIPSIPEENIQVIPLKAMKYNNQRINLSNKNKGMKINKILKQEKITKRILLYLSNEELYHLSLVNHAGYKVCIKFILNIIYNKIVINLNNKNLIQKIWNEELLKYSNLISMNNLDNIYLNYKKSSKNINDKEIIKDLLRTFPNDSAFQRGSPCYKKLFNILKVYSIYNKDIGYAQGMNFIVAKLIKFFDDEKYSFIYLDSLFNKLKMVEVIGIKNNLEQKMKTVQFLLKILCPDILFFLERKKINHEIFTAKWYITLFSKNFKFDNLLMIIWDFAIIFGWKFIFLFSIAVIVSFKDKYINLDLFDFTQYMKNIFVFEHFNKKFNDVMKLTFKYMSQWKNITKNMSKSINDNIEKKKEIKSISEKEEEETNDINDNYKDKEEIIFNDDYAFY